MKLRFSQGASLVAALLLSAVAATGGEAGTTRDPALGTTTAKGVSATASPLVTAPVSLGTLTATRIVSSAQVSTAGAGLRNLAGGAITISGVTPPMKAAYIYWAVIGDRSVPQADFSLHLQRVAPTFSANVTIGGQLIGSGASPCWGGSRIDVFRGGVPLSVANGNGTYMIRLNAGATGSTAGDDPWINSPFPLVDGASLVLIGTGNGTVAIYDARMAGQTFYGRPGLNYTLRSPVNFSHSAEVVLHNIGADGQGGDSVTGILGTSSEFTTVAGTRIAGPGSAATDSDWNGNSGLPLPRLWDDTAHDITGIAQDVAGGLLLKVVVSAQGTTSFDCVTPVANILSVAAPQVQ